jgi:hypothetical protein
MSSDNNLRKSRKEQETENAIQDLIRQRERRVAREEARQAELQRQRLFIQVQDQRGTERRQIINREYFRNNQYRDENGHLRIDGNKVLGISEAPPERRRKDFGSDKRY